MLVLLQDAEQVPRIFFPFGAIPDTELQAWLRRSGLALPADLIELWRVTGGGDVFETETIFRPTVPSAPNSGFVEDGIEDRNSGHASDGKPGELYIFQEGVFLSAIRLADQKYVTLTKNYAVEDSFPSLDEWYIRTLRAEFGERYGLTSDKI